MLKKELTLAALAAALLTLGTADVANAAAADCYSDCSDYFGTWFYTDGGWYDDVGNYVNEGFYGLSDCFNDGNGTTWCIYQS